MAAPVKSPSKGAVLGAIADETGLNRKQVAAVFASLTAQIKKSLSNKGPGVFAIPGLVKLKIKKKPATKERVGINPFTKQEQVFKAKPASKTVKAVALKGLKDLV
jgi:nucleoid DNA-binding protein